MWIDVLRYSGIALVVFLWGFVVWRDLRTEYEPEKIIELILTFWVAWIFGGMLSFGLLHRQLGFTEWGALVGAIWATRIVVKKYEWDFWEWADSLTLVSWATAVVLYPLIDVSVLGLVMGGAAIFGWMFLVWTNKNYRRFGWYKSGKMGLTALLGLALWSVIQIAVAPFRPGELYLWEISVSQVVCGFVLSATMVNLYLRSGRKLWVKKNKQ